MNGNYDLFQANDINHVMKDELATADYSCPDDS